MARRYYALDAANARLQELRPLLERLRQDRDAVAEAQRELTRFRGSNGSDDHAQELQDRQATIREVVKRMQQTVASIDSWDITLRDITTGLIDFPALSAGRPIWLCWRLGEDDIAWWHEINDGFGGRRALADLE
ncbi:MAG: DUF2203 domain-containing protein [Chloroflexota bacterium]|nr:DUF2203 domain-containing protein [Chloroflexota bacterium]